MGSPSRNPGGPKRITPAVRDQVEALARDGVGRNDIATQTGVSAGSVTAIVRDAGLSFDRTSVADATRARQVDLAARRARLELRYLERSEELLEQISEAHVVFNFGGKDNTYEQRTLDRPPTGDIRNLMQSSSIATTASLKLAAHDLSSGTDEAKSMLVDLFTAMGTAWRDGQEQGQPA